MQCNLYKENRLASSQLELDILTMGSEREDLMDPMYVTNVCYTELAMLD